MKFICLGYADYSLFAAMSESEMAAAMETCMAYDDELRRGGHFAGGEALQAAHHAVTMRYRDGKALAIDGPYAETKEQLGGILILEASDMTQAIELMSKHPGVKFGPFEIRPADETVNAMIEARQPTSQRHMQRNPVGWFEIYVDDLARATQFYETVLGIKLQELPSPMDNLKMMAFPMSMQAGGASGSLCRMDGVKCGGGSTVVYFSCQDCGVEAARIEAAGGKLHMPKTSIGEYGAIALGVDTEGNVFGLHSPAST